MMHVRRVIRGAALVATTAIATLVASQGAMAEEVKVRFSWKLKGEYGFFYLGEQKGIYKDAGVTLKLGEGAGSQAALGSLIQGQEDVVILPEAHRWCSPHHRAGGRRDWRSPRHRSRGRGR